MLELRAAWWDSLANGLQVRLESWTPPVGQRRRPFRVTLARLGRPWHSPHLAESIASLRFKAPQECCPRCRRAITFLSLAVAYAASRFATPSPARPEEVCGAGERTYRFLKATGTFGSSVGCSQATSGSPLTPAAFRAAPAPRRHFVRSRLQRLFLRLNPCFSGSSPEKCFNSFESSSGSSTMISVDSGEIAVVHPIVFSSHCERLVRLYE